MSLRQAINKTCKDCVSPDKQNGWRKEVEQCKGYSCGLYPVRPLPIKNSPKIDVKDQND